MAGLSGSLSSTRKTGGSNRLEAVFHIASVLLACAGGGVALAAQWGRLRIDVDLLAHFAPLCLAAGLAAAGAWLLTKRRPVLTLLLCLAAIGLAGALMIEEVRAAVEVKRSPAVAGRTLKIVEFNLFKDNRDPERTAAWILAQDADILVLAETAGKSEAVLERLRPAYPHETRCAIEALCSVKVMSRQAPLPEDKTLRYTPGAGDLRCLQFQDAAGTFTIMGLQFPHPDPFAPQTRSRKALAANARLFPSEGLIILGDFNLTPWSQAMKSLDEALGIPRVTRALPTWPGPLPMFPIDHVYAGKSWRVVSVRRGPNLGSDHHPLVVELTR